MLSSEWKKPSRSSQSGGDCVEVRTLEAAVQVRDTKLGDDSPILDLKTADFAALLRQSDR